MNLPKFSVERPVTIMMIVWGIVIFSIVSYLNLPQELFPQITYPQLTVVTPYENAAPEEIETLITKTIEEAVGTVAGVKRITSISKEGLSLVIAEFGWNQNINFAALGIREKIDLIKEKLPREAEEPTVLSYNPFEKPILILSITTSREDRTPVSLRDLTKRMISDEIEKVEGVASATISGGLEREIQVEVNRDKLESRHIPLLDVSKAISSSNLNYPAGTIKESFYEYLIRTLGEFDKVRDINDVSVGGETPEEASARQPEDEKTKRVVSHDKHLIYLNDIATVVDGVKERTSYSRYNGKENISIAVQKQALGNTVRTIAKVKQKLQQLKSDIPADINVTVVDDQSKFIKSSIGGVWEAAWQGGLLVFIVLFYFLRNIWSALIVTIMIPISVMATFVLMFFTGISLNMMSLSGLAFGVGHLVDTAIVVVENIFRHSQAGEDRKTAAITGTNEVFIAVTGSILTNVVIFLPLIFVIGVFGQIIRDFALTLTFALLASLIASMTLVPLLASKGLKAGKTLALAQSKVGVFYDGMLGKFLKAKGRYLTLTFIVFVISLSVFAFLDKELMPKVDQGQFTIRINMPAGTRLEITNSVSERLEKFLLTVPEIDTINVTVGSTKESTTKNVIERLNYNQAEIVVNLKQKRRLKSSDVVQITKNNIAGMNLERARIEYILQENVFASGMATQAPVTIQLKGNDLKVLEDMTREVERKLKEIEGIYGVKDDLSEPSPEVKVFVDKDKTALYGLSVTDVAQTSLIGLKGYVASKFKEKGEEYDIRVRLRPQDRSSFKKLGEIQLQSPYGAKVQLNSIATFGKSKGPSEIRRLNQERVVSVYANIYDRPLKDITSDVDAMIARLNIPKNYFVKLAGESEDMKASFDSIRNAIISAFLLVYMIMAALFESLWQPFVIMFTIPLSVIGVAWALLFTHTSINAYVLMGFAMLGGIVTNNAIVLIDCINLFLSKGMKLTEAVVNASKVRLRPILMTALTTILGLVPMAFLGGEGAELRSPMAITVMGGLTVATFLTLIVIPALYLSTVEISKKIFKNKPKKA